MILRLAISVRRVNTKFPVIDENSAIRYEECMSIEGHALREARKKAGLTLKDLGAIVDIAKSYLSEIERGDKPLPEKYIARMPAAIRCAVGEAAISSHEAAIRRIREAINGAA